MKKKIDFLMQNFKMGKQVLITYFLSKENGDGDHSSVAFSAGSHSDVL
jgi:hypothetical protein